MNVERNRVIAVIKDFSDGLLAERSAGSVTPEESDARALHVLEQACDRVGIAPSDYAEALRTDATLAKLEHDAVVQALAGPVDPGPNDAISRESPSGQPGDLTKTRSDN